MLAPTVHTSSNRPGLPPKKWQAARRRQQLVAAAPGVQVLHQKSLSNTNLRRLLPHRGQPPLPPQQTDMFNIAPAPAARRGAAGSARPACCARSRPAGPAGSPPVPPCAAGGKNKQRTESRLVQNEVSSSPCRVASSACLCCRRREHGPAVRLSSETDCLTAPAGSASGALCCRPLPTRTCSIQVGTGLRALHGHPGRLAASSTTRSHMVVVRQLLAHFDQPLVLLKQLAVANGLYALEVDFEFRTKGEHMANLLECSSPVPMACGGNDLTERVESPSVLDLSKQEQATASSRLRLIKQARTAPAGRACCCKHEDKRQ